MASPQRWRCFFVLVTTTASELLHRRALVRTVTALAALCPPQAAKGASKPEALAPILAFSAATAEAAAAANASDLRRCDAALRRIPGSEVAFKAAFDAFSEGKSCARARRAGGAGTPRSTCSHLPLFALLPAADLTQYKDKNAFVVGLTGGFDGPGRPRMGTREAADPQAELQAEQFGLRNEAWAALDDGRGTLGYLLAPAAAGASEEDLGDLRAALHTADGAIRAYVALVPPAVVQDAQRLGQQPR